jgi:hypothetical protein
VNGDARVGRARTAGDDADAGFACGLGVALGHECGAAFLAIGNQFDFRKIYQPIDHRDVAFARHAKNMFHTLIAQTLSDCVTSKHTIPPGSLYFLSLLTYRLFAVAVNVWWPSPQRFGCSNIVYPITTMAESAQAQEFALMCIGD